MLAEKPLRRADLVTGIVLCLISFLIVFDALRMPMGGTLGGVQNSWYVSPAALPLAIGAMLFACGAFLTIRSVRMEAFKGFAFQPFAERSLATHMIKLLGIVGILIVYVALLRLRPMEGFAKGFAALGFENMAMTRFLTQGAGASYFSSSFVFLFLFTEAFYEPDKRFGNWRRHTLLVGISALVPFWIGFVFSHYLSVPLP